MVRIGALIGYGFKCSVCSQRTRANRGRWCVFDGGRLARVCDECIAKLNNDPSSSGGSA